MLASFARMITLRKCCRRELDQVMVSCCAVVGILAVPEGAEVVIVGTVYKDMKLKPSILDEYVKVHLASLVIPDLH